METQSTSDTVPGIRAAAVAAVAAEGLRHVAREVGMSPSGLQKFLDGGRPYASTLKKLHAWHERMCPPPSPPADVDAALGSLLRDFPPGWRDGVRRELVQLLRRAYGRAAVPVPSWLSGSAR